jgi:hypothetical protein
MPSPLARPQDLQGGLRGIHRDPADRGIQEEVARAVGLGEDGLPGRCDVGPAMSAVGRAQDGPTGHPPASRRIDHVDPERDRRRGGSGRGGRRWAGGGRRREGRRDAGHRRAGRRGRGGGSRHSGRRRHRDHGARDEERQEQLDDGGKSAHGPHLSVEIPTVTTPPRARVSPRRDSPKRRAAGRDKPTIRAASPAWQRESNRAHVHRHRTCPKIHYPRSAPRPPQRATRRAPPRSGAEPPGPGGHVQRAAHPGARREGDHAVGPGDVRDAERADGAGTDPAAVI